MKLQVDNNWRDLTVGSTHNWLTVQFEAKTVDDARSVDTRT